MNYELDNIINACKKGDREAQQKVYELYAAKMRAVCRRYCKNTDDAEDLLQEGFMFVFKKIGQFKWKGSFEGWMRTVFIGKSVNYVKSKDFKVFNQSVEVDSDTFYHADEDDKERELFYKSENIEIEDELSIDELIAVLQELPNGYRVVFNLYAIEEYTHKEISKLLDITIGTSKSQLSKARKLLQMHLANYLAKKKESQRTNESRVLKVVI